MKTVNLSRFYIVKLMNSSSDCMVACIETGSVYHIEKIMAKWGGGIEYGKFRRI